MPISPSTQFAWLRKFSEENVILVTWNAVLLCGGSILLFYHASLLYLPSFSLGDLAGLMASVTFIGIFVLIFFVSTCFFPAIVLRWIYNDWPLIPHRGYFESAKEKITLLIFPILLWGIYLFIPNDWRSEWPNFFSPWSFILLTIISSIAIAFLFSKSVIKPRKTSLLKYPVFQRDALGLFLWSFLFFFPIETAIIFADAGELDRQILIAASTVCILATFNGVVFITPRGKVRYSLAMGTLLTAIVIPLISGQSLFFPKTVMQILSLGNRNAAALTVSGKNCFAFKRFNIKCSDFDTKDGALHFENVNVLSRVGKDVLIEFLIHEVPIDSDKQKATPTDQPSQNLSLHQSLRSLYCPVQNKDNKMCGNCDAILLQHANKNNNFSKKNQEYQERLICMQLTIPKEDILNISFSGKRNYSGYSSFMLPEPDLKNSHSEKTSE